MRKKKILVHGTPDSLQKFLADSGSRDFEITTALSARPKKISVMYNGKPLDAITPKNLPAFNYRLIDGIIFTGKNKSAADFFRNQGLEPRKIILWDEKKGWQAVEEKAEDGTQVFYFYGLEFHIRNQDDRREFNRIRQYINNQRTVKNWEPAHYPEVLAEDYEKRQGKPLNLDNPKTFTEKIQWLKIFDATPLKSRLADKYLVRYWVAEKIGQEYLIPLLGVWDDFDSLPDQFVLKCNHGWKMNIIVRDKKSFDLRNAREKINAWLAVDFGALSNLELHYSRIKRKIIAEKFMTNGDTSDLNDYKFSCFNGRVNHCKVMTGRTTDLRIDYFDTSWHRMHIEQKGNPNSDEPENIPPPKLGGI